MNRMQKLSLLLCLAIANPLITMNPPQTPPASNNTNGALQTAASAFGTVLDAFGRGAQRVTDSIGAIMEKRARRIAEEQQATIAKKDSLETEEKRLTVKIAAAETNSQRTPLQEQILLQDKQDLATTRKKLDGINRDLARKEKALDKLDEMQDTSLNNLMEYSNLGPSMLKKSLEVELELKLARGKAEAEAASKAAAARAAVQEVITAFNDPNSVLQVGKYALIVFGVYYGLKLGAQALEDWYRLPTLADKTTILPLHKQLYNWLFNIDVFTATRDDIILTPENASFFDEYIEATKNTLENGGYLRHLLIPGPPGTGKTLMSIVIANELGLPAIYFSASNLRNYRVEDAITKLRQLFTYAENSSVPIVIIIDESEVIFASRDKSTLGEETRLVMNQIMAKTGTEQSNFILIALTNRPQDFDSAFQSRFSETIYINPPTLAQRTDILSMYIDKYLVNPIFEGKRGWFSRQTPKPILIDESLIDTAAIDVLSKKLDTFTGRDISQLVMALRDAAMATKDIHLTKDMFDRVVQRKMDKKCKELVSVAAPAA